LSGAAHYFSLSADQGNGQGWYYYAMCLLTGKGLNRDIPKAIHHFRLSAEKGSPDGQAVFGWMTENGISTTIDLAAAARYYELSCNDSSAGAFGFGRCSQRGRGIPIDFTVAAEAFQKAADSDNADGANSIGCCLERGEGADANIEQAVDYYRKAASHSHPSGLYNIGRCLEHGRGIERDLVGASKYYRRAAELGHRSAQNSFGVFLERGIVFRSNLMLAAHYFELSAMQGDSDGANNLGFCLEHGRGVRKDIEAAAEWYRFAADHGHPDGEVNYQRCLRLLGRWNVSDRSLQISDDPQSSELARLFIAGLEDFGTRDRTCDDLVASLERLKAWMAPPTKDALAEFAGGELGRGNSGVVTLAKDQEGNLTAVKTAAVPAAEESIRHEKKILRRLNHPLVVRIREHSSRASVVTEFVENGSLADHLRDARNGDLCQLSGSTRIMRMIAGIVLAMGFVHSRQIIHCDLMPHNILLNFDWEVRICDFGHSISVDEPNFRSPVDPNSNKAWPAISSRYLALECFNDDACAESDVFSFGMILYELVVGHPIFRKTMTIPQILKALVLNDWKVDIPKWVTPEARELIQDCLATNPADRPLFIGILNRLKLIEFKLFPDVNSAKVAVFVDQIEDWERANLGE
jgi:TPR repeat protein